MTPGASIAALPHALRDRDELTRHLDGRRPAVFLDYDGTLTPIVDRPEDAVISVSMRAAVRDLGVMSGTLDLIQRGYLGTDIRDGVLHFRSRLTDRLDGLSFPMQFRGTPIRVTLKDGELTVAAHTEGLSRPIRVAVGDEACELRAGDHHTFALKQTTSVTR
jgi:Glycosyl hydrolase family 65, C-terminal domain